MTKQVYAQNRTISGYRLSQLQDMEVHEQIKHTVSEMFHNVMRSMADTGDGIEDRDVFLTVAVGPRGHYSALPQGEVHRFPRDVPEFIGLAQELMDEMANTETFNEDAIEDFAHFFSKWLAGKTEQSAQEIKKAIYA